MLIDLVRGVGPLVVGASLVDVERALGAPTKRDDFDDFVAIEWRALGLAAYGDRAGTITSVAVAFGDSLDDGVVAFAGATDRGIGATSTIADVEAAYGPAPERRGNKGEYLVYPGCLFAFEDGALRELAIDPDIVPVPRVPLPPPPGPNATSARALELVAELERRIAAHPELRLVFVPCDPAWLDNFEHAIATRLPPSYRAVVLTRGTIRVDTPLKPTLWMIPVDQLGGPSPTSWVDEGDDLVDAAVRRAVYFAFAMNDDVEDFHAFDPTSADDDGEMRVSSYRHDERFELDGGGTFADYLADEIGRLFRRFR